MAAQLTTTQAAQVCAAAAADLLRHTVDGPCGDGFAFDDENMVIELAAALDTALLLERAQAGCEARDEIDQLRAAIYKFRVDFGGLPA
ncbi:hypothetical protein [Novosphingobium huizhouense]|uniref:hypothetical protein n=1 Tax=Novosphingobium huizhouense TaxID=2866625 RepID=UPI001CD81BEE|nr:hypothetical protein [Novosphingobium huizhouense]